MDRLEVDGDVVDGCEESAGKDEAVNHGNDESAVLDQVRGYHGALALEVLENNPGGNDENEADEETNDDGRLPGVGGATVLECQDVRNGGTHHENDTKRIGLENLLLERSLLGNGIAWGLEEEEDDTSGDGTDGEVNVEAPAPGDVVRESTAQQGTDDTCQTVRSTQDASERGPLLGGCGKGNDGVGAGAEASSSEACDGATSDEGFGIGGSAADCGADFKDEDSNQERCLEREVFVDFAPGRLEGADSHEEGSAIPADLVETLELFGDFRNGSCDNGLIIC